MSDDVVSMVRVFTPLGEDAEAWSWLKRQNSIHICRTSDTFHLSDLGWYWTTFYWVLCKTNKRECSTYYHFQSKKSLKRELSISLIFFRSGSNEWHNIRFTIETIFFSSSKLASRSTLLPFEKLPNFNSQNFCPFFFLSEEKQMQVTAKVDKVHFTLHSVHVKYL